MATRVLLTIDTELTWRHFARGADWRRNLALSYDPAGVGVPYQLEVLRRHGIRACFFVDPMPAMFYGIDPIRRMVEPILEAGQEIQLHLHSFWADLQWGNRDTARYELTRFDGASQRDLIETARNLLVAAGAPPPIAFRSGSYAADEFTWAALRELGIAYDSSHNGAEHPWPSALPLDPDLIDPVRHRGLTEIPITQIRRRDGGLRPFQLCALSRGEMEAALRHAVAKTHPLVTIVGHSFELASRDGQRVNRLVRRRFDRLCAFLEANESVLPAVGFGDLEGVAAPVRSQPLPASSSRTWRRYVEQAWGTACYERPAIAATMIAAPPVAGLLFTMAAYGGLIAHVGR